MFRGKKEIKKGQNDKQILEYFFLRNAICLALTIPWYAHAYYSYAINDFSHGYYFSSYIHKDKMS